MNLFRQSQGQTSKGGGKVGPKSGNIPERKDYQVTQSLGPKEGTGREES